VWAGFGFGILVVYLVPLSPIRELRHPGDHPDDRALRCLGRLAFSGHGPLASISTSMPMFWGLVNLESALAAQNGQILIGGRWAEQTISKAGK